MNDSFHVEKWKCNIFLIFPVLPVKYEFWNYIWNVLKMNKKEAHKSLTVVYHKCLIYRVLCHWLRDRKIYADISCIYYIFHILKTSHGFVNQYYNLDIEVEMGAARPSVFVIYCARFYFTSARDFSVFILSGFFIVRSPKNSRRGRNSKLNVTLQSVWDASQVRE